MQTATQAPTAYKLTSKPYSNYRELLGTFVCVYKCASDERLATIPSKIGGAQFSYLMYS